MPDRRAAATAETVLVSAAREREPAVVLALVAAVQPEESERVPDQPGPEQADVALEPDQVPARGREQD